MKENAITAIRAVSGLSRAAFSRKYGIPVRTLENWESETTVPAPYIVQMLERVVKEDFSDSK